MTVPAPGSSVEVAQRLTGLTYPPEEVSLRARLIYEAVLRESPRVTAGNFQTVAAADLGLMFDLYDEHFFAGGLRNLLAAAKSPLSFALSARLTRSAGVTKRFSLRPGGAAGPGTRYEIILSSPLLFQSFRDVERTVRVNGVVCNDRLEAAQRVFEHELLHLLEMLVWVKSNCSAERYKGLAWNLFAHAETRHDLVTQHERAKARFDVHVGDRVAFEFEGVRHVGVVNRITRRATVLVESERGKPYSDGRKYLKYYIPLPMLEKAAAEA